MIPSSDSILRRQIVHRVHVDGQGHRTLELRQRVLEQVILVRRPVVEKLVRLLLVL